MKAKRQEPKKRHGIRRNRLAGPAPSGITPLTPPLCMRPPSCPRAGASAHLWYTARAVFTFRDARGEWYISCARLFVFSTALSATGRFSLIDNWRWRRKSGWYRRVGLRVLVLLGLPMPRHHPRRELDDEVVRENPMTAVVLCEIGLCRAWCRGPYRIVLCPTTALAAL